MRCPRCGIETRPGDVFCSECGMRIIGKSGPGTVEAEQTPAALSTTTPEAEDKPQGEMRPEAATEKAARREPAKQEDEPAAQVVPTQARGVVPAAQPAAEQPPPSRPPQQAVPPPVRPGGPRTSGMAITSLVLAIGGLTFLPVVGSVLSIVFGAIARSDIKRSRGELRGSGLAAAGISIGVVVLVLWVLVFAVGLPVFHVYFLPQLRAQHNLVQGTRAAQIYYGTNDDSYDGMTASELAELEPDVEFRDTPGSEPDVVYVKEAEEDAARLFCYSERGDKYVSAAIGDDWSYSFSYEYIDTDAWEQFERYYPFD